MYYGLLTGGTITSIEERFASGRLVYSITGTDVPVDTYFAYADLNDMVGLRAYAAWAATGSSAGPGPTSSTAATRQAAWASTTS